MTIPAVSPALPYLDIMDPEFRSDSEEVRAARATHWCSRTPMGFAALRYDKVTELLADRRLRQGSYQILAAQGITEGPLVEWLNSVILSVEGDDHTRLRRLVSRAFTPRAIAELRPRMSEIANELVDRFYGAGRVDFMEAFADRYPARVICELLGVPREQHDAFRGWSNDLGLAFSFTAAANLERIEAALAGLHAATDVLLAERRARPADDLLSALIAAEADGSRLSTEELRLMVTALLFAGQDTTSHQIGNAIAMFLRHPEQWTMLAQQPELAAQAVDEVIRIAPTSPMTSRIATEDLEVDGVTFPADSHLALFLAAANTDPDAFGADADRFDITASRRPLLTFGGGIHYCLGAYLTRIEMAEALPLLARRLGPIELDGDPTWRPAMGIAGPVTLPIRFRREAT
ncbi:cytochrome P450 [Pseudonocardia alaniniphila]|uniref:Cytochrome P450 n=1 Tax=Pseudonocardia alaniniphila TaxID=75291 RepID=A0ABS9T8V9_9PSEU|nr:cytochrome P450 [Pseudonocardia alaniniphila]MCH6164967.1 cytochrome P450 [Pseudonocardia alaniniphila]